MVVSSIPGPGYRVLWDSDGYCLESSKVLGLKQERQLTFHLSLS